jgi:hypothetical protein
MQRHGHIFIPSKLVGIGGWHFFLLSDSFLRYIEDLVSSFVHLNHQCPISKNRQLIQSIQINSTLASKVYLAQEKLVDLRICVI